MPPPEAAAPSTLGFGSSLPCFAHVMLCVIGFFQCPKHTMCVPFVFLSCSLPARPKHASVISLVSVSVCLSLSRCSQRLMLSCSVSPGAPKAILFFVEPGPQGLAPIASRTSTLLLVALTTRSTSGHRLATLYVFGSGNFEHFCSLRLAMLRFLTWRHLAFLVSVFLFAALCTFQYCCFVFVGGFPICTSPHATCCGFCSQEHSH